MEKIKAYRVGNSIWISMHPYQQSIKVVIPGGRGGRKKDSNAFKTRNQCIVAFNKYYKKLIQAMETFNKEQFDFYELTIDQKANSDKKIIATKLRKLKRSLQRKNYIKKGCKFDIGYIAKYEYQKNGKLHIHLLLIFLDVKRAPLHYTKKIHKIWGLGGVHHTTIKDYKGGLEGYIDYLKKNDENNATEGNLTKFKKDEQVFSISKNLPLLEVEEIEIDESQLSDYKVVNKDSHYYKDENTGEIKECVDRLYLRKKV